MRRLLVGLIAALAAASAFLVLSAGQALADHVKCGDVITHDTTLDSDLIDCPGDGLVIGADNITLDLNGHTIAGASRAIGIEVLGDPENVAGDGSVRLTGDTIEGGRVQEFGDGVYVRGSNHVVKNMTLIDNSAE